MSLWHIILTRGEKSLMEEIRDALDLLSKLAWHQKQISDIDRQVEGLEAQRLKLTDKALSLKPLVLALLRANPAARAIDLPHCHVLIREGDGYRVEPITSQFSLDEPDTDEPDPPLIPADVASEILTRIGSPVEGADTTAGGIYLPADAHDRIQNGQPTEADRDMMAAVHAYAQTFDDPDVEGEE